MDADFDRKLRTLSVYMFPLALGLGIPAGTNGPTIIVPFGIIPAFITGVLGVIGLGGGLKKPCVALPFDSIMIAAYTGLLIPTWIKLANPGTAQNSRGVMIATYATVPIIINLIIHTYCVGRHLPLTTSHSQAVCPNCQHEHDVRSKFHFHPPSTIFPPSTIYTPEDDEDDEERSSQAPLARDYDTMHGRASSDVDGSTLWAGEGRQLTAPAQQAYDAKFGNGRQM